jgi:hypothetical protein
MSAPRHPLYSNKLQRIVIFVIFWPEKMMICKILIKKIKNMMQNTSLLFSTTLKVSPQKSVSHIYDLHWVK